MRFRTSRAFLCVAPLLMALAAFTEQKDAAAPADEPHYDLSTSMDALMIITDVKDVAPGTAVSGTHLMVRPESSRAGSESTDVYLAPDDYLKEFDCHFAKGDRVQVRGSRVKYNGNSIVLAREVRLSSTTLYLRDEQGVPYWKKS